ncbi:B12-binding domain-containing radical SAM protein [[Eubacterium] cellulosolvens]
MINRIPNPLQINLSKIPEPPANGGKMIVLTASRSEMSQYDYDPFVAFTCTFPHKLIPKKVKEKWLRPISMKDDGNKFAPYGLRKIEAMLMDEFGENNVVVAHYQNLEKFIGPNTKLLGISTMDPLGLAYVSTTYNSLLSFGGEAVNSYEFKKLLAHPAIKRYKPKIIVGGSGVWQIHDAGFQETFEITTLFQGEAERDLIPLVRKMVRDEKVPKYVISKKPDYKNIPFIKHAGTYGTVEITRGCGRGCQFCSPTMRKKHSFPISHIMKEVEITVNNGCKMIFPNSEDIFLYKSNPGFKPNRDQIVKLFKAICSYPGIELIHLSHASLAPIIYDPKILEELSPLLLEKTKRRLRGKRFVTVEVGVETGSVRLMQKYMKGKALPYSVDRWPELVCEGIGIMNDNDWYPLCTIMAGMPDESEKDVLATLELIDDLKGYKLFYTPVLFIPLKEAMLHDAHRASLKNFNKLHWEFITTSWRRNIDIWSDQKWDWFVKITVLSTLLYYRLKHGPNTTRSLLNLAGFPGFNLNLRPDKKCEPGLCEDEPEHFRKM